MATQLDITNHWQGDAQIIINDELTGDVVDITNGRVQWLLFEQEADATGADDESQNALLVKSSDTSTTFTNWTNEIEIDDATIGAFSILVEPGDTLDLVPSGVPETTMHHRCRVWNEQGKRATVFQGDFHIRS